MSDHLLEIRDLAIRSHAGDRLIVESFEFTVGRSETVAIVGESGSGKTLAMRAVDGLLPEGVTATGSVRFRGRELLVDADGRVSELRGSSIGMVMQDPFTMLNPLMKAGQHVGEFLRDPSGRKLGRRAMRSEVVQRLAEVGITDPSAADRYPFELSGGMRQRVAIAAALARDPDLLIADEPSTALDVTTQRAILDLLKRLQEERGLGLVLVTHDLGVAFEVCDRVEVLYAGRHLESAPATAMHTEPLHPYTLGLLLAEPSPTVAVRRLRTIPGSVPDAREGRSCVFADRCAWVTQRCSTEPAPLLSAGTGRKSACIRIHEIRDGIIQEIRRVEPAREASDTRPSEAPIVEAAELSKTFERRGVRVEALKSVSITVRPGESVGIVGESGSGKTTLTRCLLGLESPDSGRILFDGVELDLRGSRSDARRFRRDVQVVFQDPYSSLNPARSIGATLCEALGMAPASSRTAQDLLELVGLPPAFAARRPAALSGGQRQRVAIARALAVAPRLIVCDEPVSALDVSVQAQILNLLADIRDELGVAYLFVTHDLAVVRQAVDRVYVMKAGEVLESGSTSDVLDDPSHDYTRRLVAARPAPSRLQ